MERLAITLLSAQDISTAVLLATYTATEDGELFAQLYLSGLAGGGTYRACLTKQLGGIGSAYQSPTTSVGIAATVATVYLPTISIPVKAGDVVKVYAEGLAGDTSVAGAVEIFEGAYNVELAEIQADLNNPDQYKADVSALALESTLTAIKGAGWTDETLMAIKAAIDAGTVDEATIRAAIGLTAANLDTQLGNIQTDLDTPDQYKANVSGLAPANEYDVELAAIQADLDNPDQYKADVSSIDLSSIENTLAEIKGVGWTDETLVSLMTAIISGGVDEEAIRSAVGLASANLDTQLAAVPTLEEIWVTHAPRTLTLTATEILALVTEDRISQVRGSTWIIPLTDIVLSGDKVQFAIKSHEKMQDSDAVLLVDTETGLLIVNGEAVSDGAGAELTYVGTNLVLKVEARITAKLLTGNLIYGIQSIASSGVVVEPYTGIFTISADVVRATS